jgi:BAR domain
MEKLHKSMNLYVKSISKRNEAEDKEKSLPVGYLGRIMINHGEDFENDSEFGQCLISASAALFGESKLIASRSWPYTGESGTNPGDVRRELDIDLARVLGKVTCSNERISNC